MSATIAEYLTEDHHRLDRLLALALESASGEQPIDEEIYLAFKAGMLLLMRLEETILLPAARAANDGEPIPLAAKLWLDHGAIVAMLVPPPTEKILHTLQTVLDAHNKLEEDPDGAYAECETLLGSEIEGILNLFAATPPVPMARNLNIVRAMQSAANALERAGFSRSLIGY